VHIQVEFTDGSGAHEPVVEVHRNVYDPAGVTFGAIYETVHKRGAVAVYNSRGDFFLPDTTVREQIAILERESSRVPLHAYEVDMLFCHLVMPSDVEFEEMRRNGRVEGGWADYD
jgi:hypothetical protein